ncbi:MAG TPA: SDR family NAD(P)-dependent oxidoreductase, partial [Pyrinomonadaceae bacterium]
MSDYVKRILRLVEGRELSTASAKSLIADYLRETGQTLDVTAAGTVSDEGGRHDIAVVGMSGRFPGALDVGEFWENLRAGACAVTEVPRERWDVQAYYDPRGGPGKSPCKWGGFLSGVDLFDPLFFSVSGSEAELTDPQQRVFLEECWKALEDAGYADWWLSGRRCGVFVGVGAGDYTHEMIARDLPPDPYAFLGNSVSVLASRISYLLNLRGPSLAVDTACSSSLVAVHLACQSLRSGESELALAGGVFLSATSGFHYLTGRLGMLSPTGRCYAFDDAADGFVPGEAAGVIVLRPLADALRDGDHVYGVIRASGVNQDGRTNGITAPSSISQSELEEEVYRKAGVNPESIGYVEAHGTGTRLGDPIEVEALTRAFRRHTDRREFCALGSAKTNIGHAGAAAGIVGLIKTLLSLRHGLIPPSLNFQTPNRHLRLPESPFYVNTTLRDWPVEGGRPRRAAVSAFGLSGVNAHVLLEETPAPAADPARPDRVHERPAPYQLVTVSARTQDSFDARLADLERWLVAEGARHALPDIAYTLNYGRSHFELRAAFVVGSAEELVERIRSLRQSGEAADCCTSADASLDAVEPAAVGGPPTPTEALGYAAADGEGVKAALSSLAAAYARGEEIDWHIVYADGGRRRVSLPTYPFSRERYWLPESAPTAARHEEVSTYFFTRVWRPSELPRTEPTSAPVRVRVVGGSEEFVAELRRYLAAGAGVSWQPRYCAPDYQALLPAPGQERAAVLLIRDVAEDVEQVSPESLAEELGPQFELAAGLSEAEQGVRPRVLSIHWGAGGAREAAHEAEAALAPSLRALDPRVVWQTLKLDPALRDARLVARLAALELEHDARDADEIYYDAGRRRHTRQTVPVDLKGADDAAPIRRQGVYLITGGAGALGLIFARHFVRRYAGRVVLTGRSEMTPELRAVLDGIGDGVDYVVADATSPAEMRRAVEFARGRHGALHGVVHAAGGITPELVRQKTAEQRERVLRPKMSGAFVLDEVTKGEPLDFFVLFSSLSAVVGDFGQCDYAAANRFLDGFAAWRAARVEAGERRGRTLGINWPLWKCGGMNFAAGEESAYADATGLHSLETDAGLDAFGRALASGLTQVLVAAGERRRVERLLGVVPREPAPAAARGADNENGRVTAGGRAFGAGASSRDGAGAVDDGSLLRAVQEEVRALLAQVLKVRADKLGFDAGFGSFGLESINMKGFADLLGGRYGVSLSPTLFFEHNTIAALARHLLREYPELFPAREGARAETGPAPSAPAPEADERAASVPVVEGAGERRRTPAGGPDEAIEADDELIAIIGASGRFPQSENLEEFWEHLAAGRDLITEIPPERWDWRDYQAASDADRAKSVSRWGGFMPGLDRFDAAFFQMSPREAAFTDPQHRVFLETAWHTIEDAGYRPSSLAGRRVGLFVGCQFNEYMALIGDAGEARAQAALGNTHTMLANRVSYLLDLRGPSEAVDTACSSGLVALHRAVSSILSGECELALAGGVSAILSPETYVLSTQLGMLSPDGRCKTFDRSANGYVKGEGVGAVLLKRLGRAIADGDHVYAVVRATAVNHGGKANSLTAPNPDAQAQLVGEAIRRARVSPASISYVEAHGTGTELGDPIEVDALRRAFAAQAAERGESLPAGQFCGLGSVKSNIGHLEPAAGIAGLLKVLLALKHRRLPATLHVEHVNPYLRLEGGPFYVVREPRDWTAGVDEQGRPAPRRAGVSSFGFGGSNAHVVLEEFVAAPGDGVGPREPAAPAPIRSVVPLSARNEGRLREYVRLVADFLERSPAAGQADFWPDFVFTMQEGREAFEERVAFVADSAADLRQKLRAWLEGGDVPDSFGGNTRRAAPAASLFDTREEWDEFLRGAVSKGRLDKLARLWAEGAEVDWKLLGGGRGGRRLPLPTYPFERARHWFDSVAKPAPPTPERLHQTARQPPPPVEEAVAKAAPPPELTANIRERVTQLLAAALYLEVSDIDASVSFSELGLDSILAVELVKEINQEFGTDFKATRLYDYPSVETLSAFLAHGVSTAGHAAGEGGARAEEAPPSPEAGWGRVAPDVSKDDAPGPFVSDELPRSAPVQLAAAGVEARLKELLAATLYLDVSDVDEETKFVDLGLDSILAVELVKQINEAFGTNLKATRLYDHSSVRELSDFLTRPAAAGANPAEDEEPAAPPPSRPAESLLTESAPASSHLTSVEQSLRRRLAGKLLVQESDLDDDLDLLELGFDPVTAESLAREINQEFGTAFEGTRLLRCSNLRELSRDVLADIAGRHEARAPEEAEACGQGATAHAEAPAPAASRASREAAPPAPARAACDIAVIGMSGRFPGADNLEEFWDNLVRGVDSVTEIPPSRWDAGLTYDPDPNAPNKSYCRRGGFLADVDSFDPFFFHLSPRDAEIMDPQQRLFLEEGWRALEDAGYSDAALSNKRCAVFVGAGQGDYFLKFTRGDNQVTGQFGMGNVNSILAARLSYFLNLKGPSVAVDTACSSSLVAVHLACQSIASGESEMALAGGVFVMTTPQTHILTSQARMLAPDGRCKTFDAAADGFVPGEGVGAVVLKPLDRALADGDHVYGVIRGSATNQDGKTNGMTAPSALSQTELQLSVYRNHGLDPSTFTYVEAHGTGTKLGDPIEIDALTESFRRYTDRTRFCAVGSVKTNIGHSLPAAGIAALIKVLLALRHRQLPPSLHCRRENEHIDFASGPFFVNVEPRAWT